MKKILSLVLILILSGFVLGQSVLEIPAYDDQGNPIVNALINMLLRIQM
jgi:hypothetical protein